MANSMRNHLQMLRFFFSTNEMEYKVVGGLIWDNEVIGSLISHTFNI